MISLKRTNQGGSVLTFIIIATVLAGAVIGTAYFVKQRGEQVRQEQAVAQADKLAKEADTKKPATTNNSTKSNGEASPNTNKPAPAPTKSSPSPTAAEQASLPTTGPESDGLRLLAIGLLVASGAGYITSRRILGRSL
ncbi:LPXTG cell wall anchor domain-containing protein [Candidatus Saccharibacteria bacterium]|nr:LPXTG cell wall anchor domain-containing protein [Candidatus Saccharibacteria bacterium]